MNQARLAWAAFKSMLRSAANDPIWAIVALCMAPFRAFKPVVGSIVLLGLVGMIVAVVGDLILALFGLSKQVARSIIGLVVIAVLLPPGFPAHHQSHDPPFRQHERRHPRFCALCHG